MNKIWIITLFPEYFTSFLEHGVAARALKDRVKIVSLRDFSSKDFKGVDAAPYGGGPGMVMRADILKNALDSIDSENKHVVFPSPRGYVWSNKKARTFAQNFNKDLVFICGRYEGIDERFTEKYVDEQISLGDFILTGGEIATMAILDSSIRFAGALGNKESALDESFEHGLLEHPQYTRPAIFEGMEVPTILTSGHHAKVKEYQKSEQIRITKDNRPDLL